MALCCQGKSGEEWVIIVRYGRRLERSWNCSFYFECDLKLLGHDRYVMQGLWWQDGLVPEARAQLEMIAFSVDPQWCGLLFSVYCRHEKGGFPQADPFATCSSAGPPLDADWIAIAGSVGFEICRLSSTWALILESVKATGVILLVSIGSLVCYKIYNHYWPRNRPRREDGEDNGQLVEDTGDENADELVMKSSVCFDGHLSLSSRKKRLYGDSEITRANGDDKNHQGKRVISLTVLRIIKIDAYAQGRYFGPTEGSSFPVDRSYPCSRSASGSIYPNSSTSQSEQGEDSQDTDSEESIERKPKEQNDSESRHQSLGANNRGWLVDKINRTASAALQSVELPGNAWLNISALREKRNKTLGSKRSIPRDAEDVQIRGTSDCDGGGVSWNSHFESGRLIRDESYDSLGFSKKLPHDRSFDSTCSEFSLPESSFDVDNGTMLCMDKLEQAIDEVKTDCLDIDKEYANIISNRNLPGMSSLMSAKVCNDQEGAEEHTTTQETARACFAGLYSLTTIKNSTSSDLSDSFSTPVRGLGAQGSIGSAESLAWDSPILVASPAKHGLEELAENEEWKQVSLCRTLDAQVNQGDSEESLEHVDELMESLEWDEDDFKKYAEKSFDDVSEENRSPHTERSKRESSSGFESGCWMADSCTSVQSDCPTRSSWACWSSEESGWVEFDDAVTPEERNTTNSTPRICSNNASETSTPVSENALSDLMSPSVQIMNVGHQINLRQYAFREWQGDTVRAKTILQGYSEIPSLLKLENIRQIRGDNYCGIRAAIFQTLSQGLPVPNGADTFQFLTRAFDSDASWLKDWSFANRLPYQGNNVLRGMEMCLHTLDNMASHLSSVESKSEELVTLLNNDPNVDLHIVEAVKLHMLRCAMQLHQLNLSGTGDVPLFAMLLFARETSQTPRDLMNNHLGEVGNSGGLEQIEMILLGYTLGVMLRVVRPSAYGTEDFLCSYPDWSEGNWPQVFLIAEDDRHYNVLVN
ncbi:hypothetical protein C0J52_01251 [Blattella germanica]|nr:hypothetical protein C0J52_01251 [Blattella germanica]